MPLQLSVFFQKYLYLFSAFIFLLLSPFSHTRVGTWFCLIVSFLVIIKRADWHQLKKIPWVVSAIMLWALLSLLSISWSAYPDITSSALRNEVFFSVLAFIVFFFLSQNHRAWHFFIVSIFISILLTFCVTLFNYGNVDPTRWSMLHDCGFYGSFLSIASALVIIPLLGQVFPLSKIVGVVIIAGIIFFGYDNNSRMAILGFGLVTLFYSILYLYRRQQFSLVKTAIIIVLSLTIAGMFGIKGIKNKLPEPDMSWKEIATYYSHDEPRVKIWRYWVTKIIEKPEGTGYGWKVAPKHYFRSGKYEVPDWQHNALMYSHTHNLILDYGVQLGYLGIVIILFLFGTIFLTFWRFYINNSSQIIAPLAGMGVTLLIFMKNQTDMFWVGHHIVYFFAIIGMILGYCVHEFEQLDSND
ncbi:MAG: O-antigen ligase family protein [Methylococcales bacterium]|nr:O-antigen ligase family protein [Methylococcales bacterium]